MSTPPEERRAARGNALWVGATLLGVLLPALLLLRNPRYFFNGDTQAAYLGWQYHLGSQVLSGHWPLIDPTAWQAGNLVADGQGGLFSPVIIAVGVLSTVCGNVLVFATVMKLVLACVGATGVFALARSYGAVAPLACVAAVAAPLGGMSQYLDLSSWLAGLMIWALVPWVWWALRRLTLAHHNPLLALVLGYLLVTVGYVYGTIVLILVLLVCLLECRVARDRAASLRVLGVGVVCGLVAFTVYLPGILTGPVANRSFLVALTGKFGTDPLAMLSSVLPTASVRGTTLHVLPYAYAAWFLPVLAWLDVDRMRRGWRSAAGLLAMTAVMLLLVLGPAHLGPLRWPLRLQPFLVQALVTLCAVVLSRYVVRRPSPRRLVGSLAWVALGGVVAAARNPDGATGVLAAVVVVAAGVVLLWLFVRGSRTGRQVTLGAGVAVALSLALTVLQHAVYPDAPSPDRNLPAATGDYRTQLSQARGDSMMVGNVSSLLEEDPSATADFLDGSAWYLNDHPVRSSYTTIGFRGFDQRYDGDYDGSTRPEVLDTLFTREPTTGRLRVDLLAVSTLLLVRQDFPAVRLAHPPSGWRVAESTTHAVTWVRDRPVPGAGSPVWTSPGTTVSRVTTDDRSTRFVVDRVSPAGGRVAIAAVAWPGYHTDVGDIGERLDGYLLTVDVPAGSAGRPVTVSFSPPGWSFEVAAWWLGVLGALAWSVAARRRRY